MLMARLSISPAEIDSHSPSILKICGSTSTGSTIKMIVRQKDRIESIRFRSGSSKKFFAKSHWQMFALVLSCESWQEILLATEYSEAHHERVMKERCDREWSQRSFWCSLGEEWGWDHNPKQLNSQQRGQHRRLGNAHGARDDPEASFRRAGNAPWAALVGCIMPPDLFGHTMSGHSWGPHKVATLWGKEKQTEWLSFRAYTEAKDTQFVST